MKNFDNYEKQECIGKGIFSEVYKIKEKNTQKIYAAKIFSYDFTQTLNDGADEKSKKIENIINIKYLSLAQNRGYCFLDFNDVRHSVIISQYLPIGSLYNIIQKQNFSQTPDILNDTKKFINIYGIAKAMSYLHSKYIVHGSLNPKNVLETDKFYPKVCDFYFPSLNPNRPIENSNMRFYIAPEIFKGGENTEKSDVYSFGMTVYSILTGDLTFDNSNENVPYDETRMNQIPQKYQELIKSCISKDESKRPCFRNIVQNFRYIENFITDTMNAEEIENYICSFDELSEVDDYPFLINAPGIDLNNFTKVQKIGSRSFGNSYEIKSKKTGKSYAAKMFLNELSERADKTQSNFFILRNVTIFSRLNHPAIKKFIGYSPVNFYEDFCPVIVTEYLKNGTLEDLLRYERNGHSFPFWNDTMRLINIYGIASAMSYLHSKNIIHRDLKPSKIIFDDHLFPKLTGFYLCKSLLPEENKNCKEINLGVMGTISFIAPEILMDLNYQKAGDVYSFAMVLYEILSKKYPFEGFNLFQIQHKVALQNDRLPLDENIPEAYRKLIQSCWEQDPDDRPTFKWIIHQLRTNPKFITRDVDERLFRKYIQYIDEQEQGICNNDSIDEVFQTYLIPEISDDI